MALQESSLLLKINFVILVLAVLVDILGLSLPFWIYYDSGTAHSGLWQYCPAAGYCYGVPFSTSTCKNGHPLSLSLSLSLSLCSVKLTSHHLFKMSVQVPFISFIKRP